MFKVCFKCYFRQLEEFDLFGFLSWNFNCKKIVGNKIFLWENANWNEPFTNILGNYLLSENASWRFWLPKTAKYDPVQKRQGLWFPHCESFRPRFSLENPSALFYRPRKPKVNYPLPNRYLPKLIVGCPWLLRVGCSNSFRSGPRHCRLPLIDN